MHPWRQRSHPIFGTKIKHVLLDLHKSIQQQDEKCGYKNRSFTNQNQNENESWEIDYSIKKKKKKKEKKKKKKAERNDYLRE